MKFNTLIKKYCVLGIALAGVLSTNKASAQHDNPIALIGGQGDAPYAAFILEDGSIAKLPGLPLSGLTYRVAINPTGHGIIGGTNSTKAYAALVSPQGILNPVPDLITPGEIYTVGINKAGNSIIGGGHLDSNVPYAALVSNQGSLTPINVPLSGLIYSVAIDNFGEGIIGGIGPLNSAYAGLVSPAGIAAPFAGLPATGAIYWVASNDSSTRFIGGQENSNIYAAFINSQGTVLPVSGLPAGLNYSVALNNSGQAIMGGTASDRPYAALVAPDGSVKQFFGLPSAEGKIYTVGINASGTGVLAGFSGNRPIGGLTLPNGAYVPFIGLPTGTGFVDGAGIHDAGVAIIGGTSDNTPFVAVVAPNGNLTFLNGLPTNGEINTISISTLDGLVPKSIGPFDSWANTQFALNDALTQHCLFHRHNSRGCGCNSGLPSFHLDNGNSSVWLSVLGSYVREKSPHSFPDFSNNITGVLVGYDYLGIQDTVIGGGFAYAHNSIHYGNSGGKAASDQEYGFIYFSHSGPVLYVNAALWGGVFHTKNKRRSLNFITSTANPSGWNLSPHVEISCPMPMSVCCQKFVVDPFVSLDWSHNWQNHFCEKGASGFNIELKDQHTSIVRTELGLRFYEAFEFDWGNLFLEEKLSYVNRAPVHGKKSVSAAFIGAWSSFTVDTLNSSAISQGIYQLHAECSPTCLNSIYASLDFQGSFGTQINSQTLTFSIGKSF